MEEDVPKKRGSTWVLLLVVVIAAFITYAGTSVYYKQTIDSLETKSEDLMVQLEELKSQPAPTAPPPEIITKEVVKQVTSGGISCQDCHGEIKSHDLQNMTKLAAIKGKPARICTSDACHGTVIHGIHKTLLDAKKIDCASCHSFEPGKEAIPKKRPGDITVCEQCHYEGRYIDIHVTKGKGSCSTCHLGNAGQIHKPVMPDIGALLSQQ